MHIIEKIALNMDKLNVKYCHFKSNEHLYESFQGISDFDILVDSRFKKEVDSVLIKHNCKRFEPEYIGYYPGVENWLAFDVKSGKIFHIHLHYQLITGKKLVKDFVLPWTDIILDNCIRSKHWEINISNSNHEILLLLSRIIVKAKFRDVTKALLRIYTLEKDMQAEYKFLKKYIDSNKLKTASKEMFSPQIADRLVEFILKNDNLTAKGFLYLNKLFKKEFKNYRRYSPISANFKSNVARSIDLKNKFFSRKMNKIILTKKVSTSGGKIISFIGVDGCGKSTVSEEISSWLGKKIECKKFYMGVGDGKKNIFASIILFFKNKRVSYSNNEKKQSTKNTRQISFKKNPRNYIKKYLHALVIYSVVKDNRKKILKMHKYRMSGGFSILDRYPQLEHENINDGLKLKEYSKILGSNLIKKLSEKEEKLMQIVKEIYPNLVFRLDISPSVSMARKPEEQIDIKSVQNKIEGIRSLKFEKSNLIEVNAEENYDDELLFIKQQIWESI